MFNAGSIPTMIAVNVFDCIGFATRSSGSFVKFVHYNMGRRTVVLI
jgi:predicted RNA binding protein YcfA (HicA-like mRNA interferase family)